MADRSRLVAMRIRNLGCISEEGVEIALDNIVCLVGRNNTGKSTILRAYELAQGSRALTEHDWCLWISTHSPYFIDPLEDHTTIIRLERHGKQTTPRTFRTETAAFADKSEKENLRALLQLDATLAEMFFGSHPIIVEGDTELAAFITSVLEEKDPLGMLVILVPARGKALIASLIKLLAHFGIEFSVLHDTDAPLRRDGKKNSAWTQNRIIANAIIAARSLGVCVRHRVSIPDFERALGTDEESKDKPILAYRHVREDASLKVHFKGLFQDLYNGEQHQAFPELGPTADADEIEKAIKSYVTEWAAKSAPDDSRFKFSSSSE